MDCMIKNGKSKVKTPWLLLAIGFVFVFNPNVSIVDVLPDFIGYIIISLALTNLSMMSEMLTDAKKSFERMILIDIFKYFALVWVFGIDSVSERASSLLLWSFVFSVFEIIFLIPAYLKLFKGLSDLGDYHRNVSIHGTLKKSKRSYTEKIRAFTLFFVVFKSVMCVLPEISDLGNASEYQISSFNLYRYIGVIRLLCCIPVIIIGIAWFVSIMRYFIRISKDSEFNESINNCYQENILPRKGLFTIKYIKIASWLLVGASALTLDFTLEGINILPDILVLVLIIPCFMYFGKTAKLNKLSTYVFASLYGIFAITAYVINAIYLNNYTYNAMDRDINAFCMYIAYVLAVAIQGIFFMLMLTSFSKELKKVISQNTGYVQGMEIDSDAERRQISEVHRELSKEFSQLLNVLVVYIVSDVVCSLYGAVYAFLRKDFGFLSIFNVLCGLVFVGMTVRFTDDLKDAVKTKYMLE